MLLTHRQLSCELEASRDEAIEAVQLQERLINDVSDLVGLPNGDAEGGALIKVDVANAREFVSKILDAILYRIDTFSNPFTDIVTDVFDAVNSITPEICNIVEDTSPALSSLINCSLTKIHIVSASNSVPSYRLSS